MGSGLVGRYVVSGRLEAVSALSVSEGREGALADISCQRDGLGRLVIPGTAVAGCLRRIVADPLWGSAPGDDEKHAAVSRITTHDALFDGEVERLEVRDGVAIDRLTGAAADRMLYGREVVAAGAKFSLTFSVDVVDAGQPQKDAEALVMRLVGALKAGITVGGSTTRGLGKVRLLDAHVTWTPLASAEAFLAYLTDGPQQITVRDEGNHARHVVSVKIPWKQRSPILVSVPAIGGIDAIPRHTLREDGVHLLLPGSSIKGVLRSRAEQIIRTLTRVDVPAAALDQFRQDLPFVTKLFGRAPDARGEGAWRGAVTCEDVLSKEPLPDWERLIDRLKPRDDEDRVAAAARLEESAWLRVDDHVAISRWTGGSDDGKLFAWVAPWPGNTAEEEWEPMSLTVDVDRLGPNPDAALMLLAHVVRDLCDGWLAFGHGATRGYGEVAADPTAVTFTWEQSGESWSLSQVFEGKVPALASTWREQTEKWVSTHSGEEPR